MQVLGKLLFSLHLGSRLGNAEFLSWLGGFPLANHGFFFFVCLFVFTARLLIMALEDTMNLMWIIFW